MWRAVKPVSQSVNQPLPTTDNDRPCEHKHTHAVQWWTTTIFLAQAQSQWMWDLMPLRFLLLAITRQDEPAHATVMCFTHFFRVSRAQFCVCVWRNVRYIYVKRRTHVILFTRRRSDLNSNINKEISRMPNIVRISYEQNYRFIRGYAAHTHAVISVDFIRKTICTCDRTKYFRLRHELVHVAFALYEIDRTSVSADHTRIPIASSSVWLSWEYLFPYFIRRFCLATWDGLFRLCPFEYPD